MEYITATDGRTYAAVLVDSAAYYNPRLVALWLNAIAAQYPGYPPAVAYDNGFSVQLRTW